MADAVRGQPPHFTTTAASVAAPCCISMPHAMMMLMSHHLACMLLTDSSAEGVVQGWVRHQASMVRGFTVSQVKSGSSRPKWPYAAVFW